MSFLDNTFINHFHFLRPLWLLGIVPVVLLAWQLWKSHNQKGQWQSLIPAHLLEHLLEGEQQSRSRFPAIAILIGGLIAVIALAGPAWRQLNTPVEKSRAPLVLVVDLSRSMLAADPAPDRLTRAKQKLTDILRSREDGLTALVAYAGDSHVVAPLTDDNATLINLVRALHPSIMPLPGSRPERGIAEAIALVKNGAGQAGTILLITDSIESSQRSAIDKELKGTGNTLSILGIGSTIGAPVPAEDGGFMRNGNGGIVMAQLDRNILRQTAQDNGGRYRDLSLDNSDIQALIPIASITDTTVRVDRNFDSWFDEGRWLTLLLLPLGLLAFRRGWLLPVLLAGVLLPSSEVHASSFWNNLWQTPDQQGQILLNNGDSTTAAETFTHPAWKAEALDQSGNPKEAAKLFGQQAAQEQNPEASARDYYNQGNALARAGELEKSLKAYEKALEKQPGLEQAKTNRKIVEELKQQQEQEQNNQQGDDGNKSQDSNDNSEQDSDQNQNSDNGSDKNNSDQQRSNQQDQNQQNSQNGDTGEQQPNNDAQENSFKDDVESEQPNNSEEQPSQPEQAEEQQQEQPAQPEEQPAQPEEQPVQSEAQPAQATPAEQQPNADADQVEAWLRRIPNDPGGLLRRKFEQQQQQRKSATQDNITW